MKRKLLVVMPKSINYLSYYEVSIAHSFEQAKSMIISAENNNEPYDDLDLPVNDKKSFTEFVDWMEKTDRKYPFSIFGYKNTAHFQKIAVMARSKGFHFNS